MHSHLKILIFISAVLMTIVACGRGRGLAWDKRIHAPIGKIDYLDPEYSWVTDLFHSTNGHEYGRVTEYSVFKRKDDRILLLAWSNRPTETQLFHVDKIGDFRKISPPSELPKNNILVLEQKQFLFVAKGTIGPEVN